MNTSPKSFTEFNKEEALACLRAELEKTRGQVEELHVLLNTYIEHDGPGAGPDINKPPASRGDGKMIFLAEHQCLLGAILESTARISKTIVALASSECSPDSKSA